MGGWVRAKKWKGKKRKGRKWRGTKGEKREKREVGEGVNGGSWERKRRETIIILRNKIIKKEKENIIMIEI